MKSCRRSLWQPSSVPSVWALAVSSGLEQAVAVSLGRASGGRLFHPFSAWPSFLYIFFFAAYFAVEYSAMFDIK
jgi:hypothetical protein